MPSWLLEKHLVLSPLKWLEIVSMAPQNHTGLTPLKPLEMLAGLLKKKHLALSPFKGWKHLQVKITSGVIRTPVVCLAALLDIIISQSRKSCLLPVDDICLYS